MKTTEERVQSILAKAAQARNAEMTADDVHSPSKPNITQITGSDRSATHKKSNRQKKIMLVLSSLVAAAAVLVLIINLPVFLFSGAKSEYQQKQNNAALNLQDTSINKQDNMEILAEQGIDVNDQSSANQNSEETALAASEGNQAEATDPSYPATILDFVQKSATVPEDRADVRKLTYVGPNAREIILFLPINPMIKTAESCQSCILTPGGETREFADGKILITVNKDSGKTSFHYYTNDYDLFGETQTVSQEILMDFVKEFLSQSR